MERLKIQEEVYEKVQTMIADRLEDARIRKGDGALCSIHEALGVVTEEYAELEDAVRSNNAMTVRNELLDIAVAAIVGIASYEANAWY
jgi:NTP pyrophosphatase (non-canonical NTP hydrolase)